MQVLADRPAHAQPPTREVPALERAGRWTTCVTGDARGTFIGTQNDGIWVLGADNSWQHFTTREGLGGDEITALTIDRRGRLWAGHARDGLSVGNGQAWRHFSPHLSLVGTRVHALTATPKTLAHDEIWVASERGLAVYDAAKNTWRVASTPDAMPSQQITTLNCNEAGDVFAGTQSDGLWILRAGQEVWQSVRATSTVADSASGVGLPGNRINAVLCRAQGVWVGTTDGLAISEDNGATWTFRRGSDWQERLRKLVTKIEPRESVVNGDLLRADWVESLGWSARGDLVIGYRDGYEIRTPNGETVQKSVVKPELLVRAITQNAAASTCIATFGGGAWQIDDTRTLNAPDATIAPLPPATVAPNALRFEALTQELAAWPREEWSKAGALPDDWTTRGDWLGRYGRHWAVICALESPRDGIWGTAPKPLQYQRHAGQNGDGMRLYIHQLYSSDPNALEMPPVYLDSRRQQGTVKDPDQTRRISEWNDNGTQHPTTLDGPNMYFAIDVPDGDFVLSLYNWNIDARNGVNSRRDYGLSLRERFEEILPGRADATDQQKFAQRAELAHGRMQHFTDGVYKKFLIRGPRFVTLEVSRNQSHITMMMGVFLDPVEEKPAPYFPESIRQQPNAPLSPTLKASDNQNFAAAARLWDAILKARRDHPLRWPQNSARFCAPLAQWMEATSQLLPPPKRAPAASQLATLYYQSGAFEKWETALRAAGERPARDIEHALTWDGKTNGVRGYDAIRNLLDGKTAVP